jgi:hypothetical protein
MYITYKMIITAISEMILNNIEFNINPRIQIKIPYITSKNLMFSSLFSASFKETLAIEGRNIIGNTVRNIFTFVNKSKGP